MPWQLQTCAGTALARRTELLERTPGPNGEHPDRLGRHAVVYFLQLAHDHLPPASHPSKPAALPISSPVP